MFDFARQLVFVITHANLSVPLSALMAFARSCRGAALAAFGRRIMPQSPAALAAASSLAEWARERRRTWTDTPLPDAAPPPAMIAVVEPLEDPIFAAVEQFEETEAAFEPVVESIPSFGANLLAGLHAFAGTLARGLTACAVAVTKAGATGIATIAGAALVAVLDQAETLRDSWVEWLMRGAAIVSTVSVVMLLAVNRGELFARWDDVAGMVVAAASRPAPPPPPAGPPPGSGRMTIASTSEGALVFVDGAPHGTAPVTIDLAAGAHRVLLRSPQGSVERAVRIRSGESTEIREAIFPGWIALSTPIDLALSEAGRPLKRDERGWAILAPGPHDIQLDNRTLGVHEVRHVVVTPGDTTRLSFAPHASTLSLTTNELAEVWIDGRSFGQAPLVDQPISLGVHDVRVRGALHERWLRVRATVQPLQVNVDLTVDRPSDTR